MKPEEQLLISIKINDTLIIDENKILNSSDFKNENMKISFGKKKHFSFKNYLGLFKTF